MTHETTDACEGPRMLGRRGALLGLGAAMALGRASLALADAPTQARLVVINLRGGLDGLSAVAPYGDPNLRRLRAPLLDAAVGRPGGMLDLGGFFGLHPAMTSLHAMYRAGQALVLHAVGNCARTRSHFEAQDYLQSGTSALLTSGWLNRAIAAMPAPPPGSVETGIAVGAMAPLLIRGPAAVAGWGPSPFTPPSPALAGQIAALTRADPLLGPALQVGLRDRATLQHARRAGVVDAGVAALAHLAATAGQFLAAPDGPRVATLESASMDTHADQMPRLEIRLAELDAVFAALKVTLGPAWSRTVVMTLTEFGRTAYGNASGGTDQGTGFAVLLAGGAVAGARVVTSWPGLSSGQLFQGRDLAPTLDYRAIAMGVLQQHLGIPASALPAIFPNAAGVAPLAGLTRA